MEITWCYNERHHGKGPMDGIGGTLKNCVYRDTMSGKCFINTPMEFAEYADKTVKGITSLYLPADEVLVEPDDIEMSPKIKDTLKIHLVKRSFDQQNHCGSCTSEYTAEQDWLQCPKCAIWFHKDCFFA